MTEQRPLTPEYIDSLFAEQQEAAALQAMDQLLEAVREKVKYDNVKQLLLEERANPHPKKQVFIRLGPTEQFIGPTLAPMDVRGKCLTQLQEHMDGIIDPQYYFSSFVVSLRGVDIVIMRK